MTETDEMDVLLVLPVSYRQAGRQADTRCHYPGPGNDGGAAAVATRPSGERLLKATQVLTTAVKRCMVTHRLLLPVKTAERPTPEKKYFMVLL